ncbi:MAG TPA: alpha/beta hydrolase, partial [Phenylobacterium sp.]
MIRWSLLAVLATSLLAPVAAAAVELTPELGREYARPHDAIDLGHGRHLNLFCMGSGPRTVLFDAGGSDWSDVWALVQPTVAKTARACAYDRAGLGHSDPSPLPRTPVEIAQDLHALVVAAKLQTPLVVVGHSLGGFNVKLYAALYPQDVAGLVLVDPSEDRTPARARSLLRGRFGSAIAARSELADLTLFAWLTDRYTRCAAAAREAPLDPLSPTYRRCTDPVRKPLGPEVAAARARIQVTAAYQEAQASEVLNSVYAGERADAVYQDLFRPGVFGRKPMVVLTHGLYDKTDPIDAAGQAVGIALHEETARLSSAGRHRVVPGTTHYIELDAPDAVAGAIAEVLGALPPH